MRLSGPARLAALGLALAFAVALVDCSAGRPGKALRRTRQRVFVIGFDGMDPTLARKWMDDGKLPNLKRLAETGTFSVLASTQPSGSPSGWSSFAPGVNPGQRNV